ERDAAALVGGKAGVGAQWEEPLSLADKLTRGRGAGQIDLAISHFDVGGAVAEANRSGRESIETELDAGPAEISRITNLRGASLRRINLGYECGGCWRSAICGLASKVGRLEGWALVARNVAEVSRCGDSGYPHMPQSIDGDCGADISNRYREE